MMSHKKHFRYIVSSLIIVIIVSLCTYAPLHDFSIQADSPDIPAVSLPPLTDVSKGHPSLDSSLSQLADAEAKGRSEAVARNIGIDIESGRVRVIIESTPGKIGDALAAAKAAGDVEISRGNLIQVMLPISALQGIANNPNVTLVRRPLQPMTDETTIESMALINASAWNSDGYNGSGIKIGVLDLGFAGYSDLLGTDLPSSVTTNWATSIGDEGTIEHGTACAEIIHDIAPEASLYFANFGTGLEWDEAIDWFIEQEVDIISCSISWMNAGPGDGTGFINDGVTNASNAGILWVNSAGNYAQRHWMGAWNDPDSNDWLNFADADETNALKNASGGFILPSGTTITIGLRWDDEWGASSNDYDLYLFDSTLDVSDPVAWSTNTQDGSQDPVEFISHTTTYEDVYHIAVMNWSADGTSQFHLNTFSHDLQYQVAEYSLLQPADSPYAVTTGAVWWNDPDKIEAFSSQGPTTDGRTKPDLVAPDGVSTVSYGAGSFFGTSAAAPHVAGAAALVLERYPSYTNTQIQAHLENTAIDLGSPGKDNVFGSGRLYLDQMPGPDTTIDPIPDVVKDVSSINGDASCTSGWIAGVEVQINRSDTGYFWNGSDWQSGSAWINASPVDGAFDSPNENWTIDTTTSPPLPSWEYDVTYYIEAKAFDNEGNYDPTPATETFTITDIGWTMMEIDTGDDLFGIWGSSASDIFVVGGDPAFETSVIGHYDGSDWTIMNEESQYVLLDIWGSSDSNVFAVGSAGTILHYNGNSWTNMESGTTDYLLGIWGTTDSNVFAVGRNGSILHYNGESWSRMASGLGSTHVMTGVWGYSDNDIYAVGYDEADFTGIILYYNGSDWEEEPGTWMPLLSIWGVDSSDIFVTGAEGTILHYDGSSWASMSSGIADMLLWSIWGTSSSNVFAAGEEGTMLYYGGSSWIPLYSGTFVDINGLWGTGMNVYAVGQRGTILRYNAYPDESVYIAGQETASQGENFDLTIRVSKTANLSSGQINLQYDPDIITVQNVSDGLLYGATTYTVPSAGNWILSGSGANDQGILEISLNLSDYSEPIGITEGTLAVVHFYANGLNTSDLQFLPTSNLFDYYSSEIQANWYDGSVTVYEGRPNPITDLECETIDRSTIRLTWRATGTGGGEYDIRYRPNEPVTEANWGYSTTLRCDGEPAPQTSPASETFDVTGLDHNTQYYFAIKVRNPDSLFSDISNTTGCETDPWYHSLNISVDPPGGGSTNGSGIHLRDSVVSINASPDPCYYFVNWSGSIDTIADVNASETNVTMLGNYSITANFVLKQFQLTTSSTAGGSVSTPGEAGPYTYDCNHVQNIVATNDSCHHFVNWTGSGVSAGKVANPALASTTITMDNNYSVQANFAINQFTLTYNAVAGGSITGTTPQTVDCGSSGSQVTATPGDCYHFVNWSDLSTDNPRTDTNVTSDITVTANFAINQFTLTYTAGTGGSISGETPQTVDCGSSGSAVEAIPDPCYHFVDWSDSSTDNPRTDTNVNGNIDVTANFAINTFNLITSSSSGGFVTTPGEGGPYNYDCGAVVDIIATPDPCYRFVSWTGETGSIANTSAASTTITMNDDYMITANFAIDTFELTTSSTAGGSVTAPGEDTYTYDCGTVVDIVAEADPCYRFVSWTGTGVGAIDDPESAVTSITMDGDYSIQANFAFAGPFYLNISSSEYGDVTAPGEGTFGPYNCGDVINLIAEADPGYELISWTGDTGTILDPGAASTNITIYGNYSITANFGLPPVGCYGDVTRDDTFGIEDYSQLRLMLFGRYPIDPSGDTNADGLIGIDDYSELRLILFNRRDCIPRYEAPYDFLSGAGTNRWAMSNTLGSIPPAGNFDSDPDGWSEAGAADYSDIALTDSDAWTISGTGGYAALQCKFTLAEIPENITSIGVTLDGSAGTNGDVLQFRAWNFDTESWTQIGGNFAMTTEIETYTAWTAWGKVFADYIDSNDHMYILVNLNTPDSNLDIDYIRLTIVRP